MSSIKRSTFFLILFLPAFCSTILFAQSHETHKVIEDQHDTDDRETHHKKHSLSASLNHTIIFSGVKNSEKKNSIGLPSFGLNYNYALSHKWFIGLHNDIIMEDFLVSKASDGPHGSESGEEDIGVIERGTPVSSALMVIFKPIENLGIMAGAGREFSSHKDFTVLRFGLEAPIHLPHHWEVFGTLSYDIMIDAYSSLTYGIGIAKLF